MSLLLLLLDLFELVFFLVILFLGWEIWYRRKICKLKRRGSW